MSRRRVSQMIDDEAGNRLGGSATELRVYDDEGLTVLSTLWPNATSGVSLPNPVTPNAGKQTTLQGGHPILTTDTVIWVNSVDSWAVGNLCSIYDGTNTVNKVITAIDTVNKKFTLDSAVGVAFATGPTLLGNPDMLGSVYFYIDDAADRHGQTKDVASTRVLPPITFPVRVPTSTIAVQEEGGAVASEPIINFIGRGVTAVDDNLNTRVNVTIGILAGSTAASPGMNKTTDATTGMYDAATGAVGIAGSGRAIVQFSDAAGTNYWEFLNDSNPVLRPIGGGTNIDVNQRAKGTGGVLFVSQATDYHALRTGSASIIWAPEGGSANVDTHVRTKGSGVVAIGSNATDYLTVVGGTGTTTLSGAGGSAAVNINVAPKGTGILQYKGVQMWPMLNAEAALGADVTTPTSGTWQDGPSVTLNANRVYLIVCQCQIKVGGQTYTAVRLYNGTTIKASGEYVGQAATTGYAHLVMVGIVTIGGSNETWKIQTTGSTSGAGGLMSTTGSASGAGSQGANATRIAAICIG